MLTMFTSCHMSSYSASLPLSYHMPSSGCTTRPCGFMLVVQVRLSLAEAVFAERCKCSVDLENKIQALMPFFFKLKNKQNKKLPSTYYGLFRQNQQAHCYCWLAVDCWMVIICLQDCYERVEHRGSLRILCRRMYSLDRSYCRNL